MSRVNQRTNNLLGRNIKRLRLESGLRNKDIIAKCGTRGVEVSTSTQRLIRHFLIYRPYNSK